MEKRGVMHGYSTLSAAEILKSVQAGDGIDTLPGDFVVCGGDEADRYLVSSFLSARPYYYAVTKQGRLVHGSNVYDVARDAGLSWAWNTRAIESLALFGHTVAADTLCHGVHRVPPASRVSVKNGRAVIDPLPARPFEWNRSDDIRPAYDCLVQVFNECVQGADKVKISLSAGYDSRLLFGLALHRGIKPHLSVMGFDDSTDVVVARNLANAVGLTLDVFQLKGDDYLSSGLEIAKATSGVKTAVNWHTYLYSSKTREAGVPHLVGSNGEFARTFFFDYEKLVGVASHMPAGAVSLYWAARCARRAAKFSRANPFVAHRMATVRNVVRASAIEKRWGASDFLSGLDTFYAAQRVRHFIGGGLACYAAFGEPRSPFLDARWLRAIAFLGRRWKVGSAYHVEATRLLKPLLAEQPYNRLPQGGQGSSYHPFSALSKSDRLMELLVESPHLDQWASRQQRLVCLNDSACNQEEERNLWLTLHFAALAQAEESSVRRVSVA